MMEGSWQQLALVRALTVFLGLSVAASARLTAQELPPLSREIDLSVYGIDDPSRLLRGSVSIVHGLTGPRLSVSELDDEVREALPIELTIAAPSLPSSGCFDLAVERGGAKNALGGRFGAYALGESSAEVDIGRDQDGRRALLFSCDGEGGVCGLWTHLFETNNRRLRTYLDARSVAAVALWLRSSQPDVVVKVADAAWIRRDDALLVGNLARVGRVTGREGGWRRIVIPMDALPPEIALDSLGSLVLERSRPGRHELSLARVELCGEDAEPASLPEPAASGLPASEPGSRAMWVWNTRELLDDEAARAEFLSFVEEEGYSHVFMQLSADRRKEREGTGHVPFDGPRMGALVAELRARGAGVYALDGDPRFALRENHRGVLRTVRALADHNRSRPPEERFEGVRYDIEPYLVEGYRGSRREELLDGWVELIAAIASISRQAGMRVAIDLPFWLDGVEAETGEPRSAVLDGERRPVLEHLLALVDNVGLMSYRTRALGTNGSVALAIDELDLAARLGATVYVGMETTWLPDVDDIAFEAIRPGRGLPPAEGGARWVILEPLDGTSARTWLVDARDVGAVAEAVDERGGSHDELLYWRAERPVRVRADRQTFHAAGWERMQQEARKVLRELSGHPAFAGIAYHHYGSLRDLKQASGR